MRLVRWIVNRIGLVLLIGGAMALGVVLSRLTVSAPVSDAVPSPGHTLIPTNTPRHSHTQIALLPTVTPPPQPTASLRPPPTFEPPTPTPMPSHTPTVAPTSTPPELEVVPGLHGLETPTPTSTPGCTLRADWPLVYEVQVGDALDNIAARYGTNRWEMTDANCLQNPDEIYIGQKLRVPGEAHPQPSIECIAWEVLTPMHYAYGIDGNGQLTFNWVGPRAPRNLVRVYDDEGEKVWEEVVDLRQNLTISLPDTLPDPGEYTWQVYPLGLDFRQINCSESPRWTFHKTGSEF